VSLILLGLTIVPDTVFLAALDVKDVAVVGFPNAHGTRVQAPIGLEAFSYDLTEVDLTSNINDPWYATTHTFISDALVPQGISPPDCLLNRTEAFACFQSNTPQRLRPTCSTG
jgi:hypothetical protein